MSEDKFDFKQLWYKALKYWYLYVLIFPLALAGAYYYLKITPPKYKVEAQLLIKDDENSGQMSEEILFSELGLGKKKKNLENEVHILRSSPLMKEVVRNNELQYRYFLKNGLVKRELYNNSPIRILDWQPTYPNGGIYGSVLPDGKGGYTFVVEDMEFHGEFGSELQLPEGRLTLSRTKNLEPGVIMEVMALPIRDMAGYFSDNLEVEAKGEESSTLNLTLKDASGERARDVLMGVIEAYNRKSVEDKNKAFENTIDLINERIDLIEQELAEAEQDVEIYKQQHNMVELTAESSLLLSEMAAYNRENSNTEVQLEIMNSMEDFLVKNQSNFEFVPTNVSINNLTLAKQLESFNQLLAERAKEESKKGAKHPDLELIQKQIQNLRETIIENIQAIKSDLKVALGAGQNQQQTLENRLRSLPRRERELVEKERKKGVKENLYLYLLQKREESAISMAVTVPTGKVVEPADIPYAPISPKGSQIWLIAFFLGMAIPSGLILLLENLNDRVQDETTIEKATSVPLLGSIAQSRRKAHQVVKEKSSSIAAEMFRLLRANLNYLTPGEDLRVVLITSSFSGEGKSFIALNLGMTQALTGKKVLLLELDLRKPKQNLYMGIERPPHGVVDYLVNPEITPKDIVHPSGLHLNLDVIVSGPKPPNPSELILSERLRKLVSELRQTYDFIILDTPPVGMVADALQLSDIPQATMYVVRAGYTRIPQLQIIEDIHNKKKMPRPFIILNALRLNQPGGTYGSGYGYGYGYYEDEPRFKKMFRRFKERRNNKKSKRPPATDQQSRTSQSGNGQSKSSKSEKAKR